MHADALILPAYISPKEWSKRDFHQGNAHLFVDRGIRGTLPDALTDCVHWSMIATALTRRRNFLGYK